MTIRNCFLMLCIVSLTTQTACSVAPAPPPAPDATSSSSDVAAGRKLFVQHCESCHGVNARGTGRAPALNTQSTVSMPEEALVTFLRHGNVRKGMPPWSQLPRERRQQLARYIRALDDLPPAR